MPAHFIPIGEPAHDPERQALRFLVEELPASYRRLYDETLSGSHGFRVFIVPGVIHNRQPRFNEGPAMWHLEGATLPLLHPLLG
jgi:hypothetical protein